MDFKDQYKHPEWQKKRLEALNSAEFTCQRCYDTDTQLHVHHKRYVKDRMIWNYPISELEVLCDRCHEDAHAEKDELQSVLAMLPTEAIPEITSVVTGYCQYANGPASLRIEDNPDIYYPEYCGKIAGLLANKMTMDELFELRMKIEEANYGDSITFTIPKRRGFV